MCQIIASYFISDRQRDYLPLRSSVTGGLTVTARPPFLLCDDDDDDEEDEDGGSEPIPLPSPISRIFSSRMSITLEREQIHTYVSILLAELCKSMNKYSVDCATHLKVTSDTRQRTPLWSGCRREMVCLFGSTADTSPWYTPIVTPQSMDTKQPSHSSAINFTKSWTTDTGSDITRTAASVRVRWWCCTVS